MDAAFFRRLERLKLAARRRTEGVGPGARRSVAPRGGSLEFADYRPYSPGDDVRSIDWNAYARLEHLYLKRFLGEGELAFHVLVDASASMGFGAPRSKLALGVRIAAALCFLALRQQDRASVTVFGGTAAEATTPLVRGRRGLVTILKLLGSSEPRPGATNLRDVGRRFLGRRGSRGAVVLISDLLFPDSEAVLGSLRAGASTLEVIQVLATEERRPRGAGEARLFDAEGDGDPVALTLDAAARADYERRTAAWLRAVRAWHRTRRIPYALASADEPDAASIARVLSEAGLLG